MGKKDPILVPQGLLGKLVFSASCHGTVPSEEHETDQEDFHGMFYYWLMFKFNGKPRNETA
jgi:hypothetical protein